ncbi:unnamed protein product [Effrenium voratum]|uniref:ApaG domain-containing protein n=1 Tax=Effrenium voratum TaxID=2562239 RepID=A0AA36IL10_9DINO|nr:unnamed protein product [Effrenium voratum]CAJ1443657.1 unnamed protein product [Effrenium voratum]
MSGLGTLNEHHLVQILQHLAPIDAKCFWPIARNEIFSTLAETYWEHHSRRVFGLSELQGPDGSVSSWHKLFRSWHKVLLQLSTSMGSAAVRSGQLALPHVRWMAVWRRIRSWLSSTPGAERIHDSLRSEAKDLSPLEQMGAVPQVMDCWRLVDGQDAPLDPQVAHMTRSMRAMTDGDEWSLGLFGGYQAYEHEVCTVFLPLVAALSITEHFCNILQARVPELKEVLQGKLIFAASYNVTKVFFVDLSDGLVYIFTRNPRSPLELAIPRGKPGDGLLRWFEEYAQRLHSTFYTMDCLRPEAHPLLCGISLFPKTAPELKVCTTRGVEVQASCIYMPEHQAGWTYSIALRLVGTFEERGFDSCQLLSRHWEIQEDGKECERTHGDGVIGLFPILVEGGWLKNRESDPHGQYEGHGRVDGLFRYQSCSGRNASMRGTFGGHLTFVPGTRKSPQGEAFQVRVEPMRLQVPTFMY